MDPKQLAIQLRLDGVKAGLQRIRVAFLVVNIAAIAMVIAEWNAYFSRSHIFLSSTELSGGSFVSAIQREEITQIMQTQVVTVALLGIRVRVEDFAVVGSLGMLVCALWLFLGLRGYYGSVSEFLEDTSEDPDLDNRRLIAHGIDSFLVFSVLRRGPKTEPHPVSRALWYIPFTVSLFIVVGDFLAAFGLSATPGTALEALKLTAQSNPGMFMRWEIFAGICVLLCFWLCRKVDTYDRTSNARLKKYFEQIPRIPILADESDGV